MQNFYKLSSFYNCFINRRRKKNITLSESPLISIVKTAVNKHKTGILLWQSYLLGAFKVTRTNSFCIELVIIRIDSTYESYFCQIHHEVNNRSTLDLKCNYLLTRTRITGFVHVYWIFCLLQPLPLPIQPKLGLQPRQNLPLFISLLIHKRKEIGSQSVQGCTLVSWLTKRAGGFPGSQIIYWYHALIKKREVIETSYNFELI